MPRQTTRRTVARARQLRAAMSLPEVLVWRELRRKAAGLKFRRQHPAGPFVIDFYCPAARLGIEIDGAAHDMGNRPERDDLRDEYLARHGITVIRIPAANILGSLADSVETIVAACRARIT